VIGKAANQDPQHWKQRIGKRQVERAIKKNAKPKHEERPEGVRREQRKIGLQTGRARGDRQKPNRRRFTQRSPEPQPEKTPNTEEKRKQRTGKRQVERAIKKNAKPKHEERPEGVRREQRKIGLQILHSPARI
jgi:hypothetical protein